MVKVKISKKAFYTLILIAGLIFVVGGIYAFGTSTPAVFGHTISEFAPPSPCSANSFIKWTGSAWACAVP